MEASQIRSLWDRTKTRYAGRDGDMARVRAVRHGDMKSVFPDLFPEGPLDKAIVANMVDVAARDVAEVLAPLPAFNCASSAQVSDAARKFAEKRTRIVNDMIAFSKLKKQAYLAADQYVTYGFVPLMVEVDGDEKRARLQ